MKTRLWIGLLAAAGLAVRGAGTPAQAAQAPARPNIVFVLVDDLRVGALGCEGHPFVKTPNVDRLAREGALFRKAFVSIPLCSPSRSSFLTGQYAHTTGIIDNTMRGPQSHQLVTFPKLLRDGGYETAYVGKWHMGNDDSPRPGFDRWVSFKGQGVYVDPPLNVDGQPVAAKGYITDLLSDYGAEFIRKKHEKPFVLYLGHKAIHGPFTPAPRHAELYANDPITRTPNAQDTLEGKPALTREVKNPMGRVLPTPGPGTGSGDMLIRSQLRCLTSIDDGVGKLIAALEETGQLDKTMIVFTSDNGYFWGEHGMGDKRAAYEESIRVPLVVRYPPLVKAGSKIDGMALNIDLAPTFLELGGQPVPKNLHGRSLLPLFRGSTAGWRTAILTEYFFEKGFPRVPGWQSVRTDRWKLIHYTDEQGLDELYDLQTDPYEMKNRIADPAAAETLKELQAELARQLAATQ